MKVDPKVLRQLPHMPGFNVPVWKDHNAKHQTWGIHNGTRIEADAASERERPKFVKAPRPPNTWRGGSWPDSHSRSVFKHSSVDDHEYMEVPGWDALQRHVLKFYGYFKEAVVETNAENFRVRNVVILYFLEDDTCQVTEPKQDNSGLPQGTLIRRHRLPLPDGRHLKVEDLKIGGHLNLYEKTMRITDCDPFTRAYYEHIGNAQGPPLPEEKDPFMMTREDIHHKSAKQPRTQEKIYREVMLGGGQPNENMRQFLENDKKVLRFHAIMDDLSTPQFERRPFIILFFLADDTMEIRELYPNNCGRDNFPIFFRRGKMARGSVEVQGPQALDKAKEEFIHGHELYVGQMVSLSGSQFFVYDADEFTRKYFTEVLGHKLEDKWDVQLPQRQVPRAKTPPYTGFGSWEDSMASVSSLIPKAPKKDLVKLFKNEGKILRFTARYVNPRPEDQKRLFVFNYNLADDHLSVHEPPQRNLGIVTGRFLEKASHVNAETGELFKPDDLKPGNIVSVYNHRFEMLGMDEYTRKTMENPDMEHKKFDLNVVLRKIRESMRQQFHLVHHIFRRFDSDHDGVLTLAEFKSALQKYGFNMSEEESLSVMKHFDRQRLGHVDYNEFCKALLDEDYANDMLKNTPPLDQQSPRRDSDVIYAQKAAAKSVDAQETADVRKAVRELGHSVYQRHGLLHKLFKAFELMTYENTVSNVQLHEALTSHGIRFNLEDIDRVILYIYPGGNLTKVCYVEFFKALMSSYHDLSAAR